MALIKCQECGREVSDKAEMCIHCGYPLDAKIKKKIITVVNRATFREKFNRWLLEADEIYRCTGINDFKIGDKVKLLDNEEKTISVEKLDTYVYYPEVGKGIRIFGFNDMSRNIAKQVKYIMKDVSDSEVQGEKEVSNNLEYTIKCPKCGSTQIQMVNRKWSLMTGILTNKVDRVCMNCKKKF